MHKYTNKNTIQTYIFIEFGPVVLQTYITSSNQIYDNDKKEYKNSRTFVRLHEQQPWPYPISTPAPPPRTTPHTCPDVLIRHIDRRSV